MPDRTLLTSIERANIAWIVREYADRKSQLRGHNPEALNRLLALASRLEAGNV